jgi:hypothetical protein
MKIVSAIVPVFRVLVGVLFLASAQTALQREKVAEGQYSEWQDGRFIADSTQSWTLWRVADGFELEDHLSPNKGAALMALFGEALGSKMSPELKEEIREAATVTEIDLRLAKDRSSTALALRGIKLSEPKSKEIEIAHCGIKETEITCQGRAGKARLRTSEQQQLLYLQPFPLLFTPILRQKELTQNQPSSFKIAIVEGEDKKLALNDVPGQITHLGQEQIVIGQYSFSAEKYVLTMEINAKPGTKVSKENQTEHRQVTLWASPQGIVFAMEDSRFVPGLRVNLTQYKKYSDF